MLGTLRRDNLSIGSVHTLGALHAGHAKVIERDADWQQTFNAA
jgi:pantothenate synthetase